MERCLPVGRVGEGGSWIRVLDHEKKTKRQKKGNNPISTFLPFKTEKNGKDGKVLTHGARRRKRFVKRSPGWSDMSKRARRGEVGSREKKRKEKGRNGAEESRGANKKGNARGSITHHAA